MIKFINKYLSCFAVAILLLSAACEEGNNVFDQIVEVEQRGAILRTVNLISNELPIGQADGSFIVELEIQDKENGTLVSSIEVYAGFNDNTAQIGPGTNVEEQLFDTIDTSSFAIGEFGLPRFNYSVTLPELLSFVGRTEDDITGGDQFPIRFELVLTDGRRFSAADNSGTLTGSYFASPFLYSPTVICPIPEGAFTGTYALVQSTPGIFGTTFVDENVEITATGGTSRVIALTGYPQFGGFPLDFPFELICDEIKIGDLDTGLACAAPNIVYGPASVVTTYDASDDSTITLTFLEDGGGCGATTEVTFVLTKQ